MAQELASLTTSTSLCAKPKLPRAPSSICAQPTTERAAASRLGVGVHLYLDWEAGQAVPPHGKRGVLPTACMTGQMSRYRRSDFVRLGVLWPACGDGRG